MVLLFGAHPSRPWIVAGKGGSVCVYDAARGQMVFREEVSDLTTGASLGEGLLVVALDSKTILTWRISAEEEQSGGLPRFTKIGEFQVPKRIAAICIVPQSDDFLVADKTGDLWRLASATADAGVHRVQDPDEGNTEPLLGHFSVLDDVDAVAHRVATGDRDNKIRVSRLPDAFVAEAFLLGHRDSIGCVRFVGGDGNMLISSSVDGSIRLWDCRKISQLDEVQLEEGTFASRMCWRDDKVVAIVDGADKLVCFTDVLKGGNLSGRMERVLEANPTSLSVCCDGTILVTLRNDAVHLFRPSGSGHDLETDPGAGEKLIAALKDVGDADKPDGVIGGEALAAQRKPEMVEEWKGKKRRVNSSVTTLLR